MNNYKAEAAKAALEFIKAGQVIGLGAGATIFHLADGITQKTNLSSSVVFTSSSFKTIQYLQSRGLNIQAPALIKELDIYFDGCDQFDEELNALKSGGGIHTTEKILASAAKEFILIGDEGKFTSQLNTTYPVVVEILPQALQIVLATLTSFFPDAKITLRMSNQKDGAVISDNGNLLADVYFSHLTDLEKLNRQLKMIPGVVEHSLFYRMATKAVVCGEQGVRIINPKKL
ncbi:ribose 5-phosphate isomerase A [Rubrolithibacter danxiaensis]|uniref:ribose 5-phosphate isomerase A n=1 Tax=Rubrolithibacter danxiaensis TaxID=3390805 RepID=UPI003BF8BF63